MYPPRFFKSSSTRRFILWTKHRNVWQAGTLLFFFSTNIIPDMINWIHTRCYGWRRNSVNCLKVQLQWPCDRWCQAWWWLRVSLLDWHTGMQTGLIKPVVNTLYFPVVVYVASISEWMCRDDCEIAMLSNTNVLRSLSERLCSSMVRLCLWCFKNREMTLYVTLNWTASMCWLKQMVHIQLTCHVCAVVN